MPEPGSRRLAFFSRKVRAPERNSASSGVSSKSILPSSQWGVGRFQLGDQAILPKPGAAERERQQLGAAVVEVAIELPGEAHAAVHLNVLLRRQEEGFVGGDPSCSGGGRQFGGIARERPSAVVGVRARQ